MRFRRNNVINPVLYVRRHLADPLYRNSFFLMASTVVTTGLGFFFWMVVANFYTEEEVGLGAAIISAVSLLALLSKLGLDFALVRFLPRSDNPVRLINSSLALVGIVSLAAASVFIAGIDVWSPALAFIRGNAVFFLVFVVFAACCTVGWLADNVFIATRRAEFVLWKNVTSSLLKIPLPIVMVLFFHAFGIFSSWGLALAVALAVSLVVFMPRAQAGYRPRPELDLGLISGIWRYSAGNYVANLFSSAPGFILPLIIVNLLGAEPNAHFYVAWMIAGLLFAIPGAVSQSLFAEGSHFEDDLWLYVRRSLTFIFLLLIPAIVLLVFVGKWLLLAFGEGYSANALLLLQVLALSGLFVALNRVYKTTLRVQERLTELIAIYGFLALAVLAGSYLITPHTGIVGVGYAWTAAHAAVSVYVVLRLVSRYRSRRRVNGVSPGEQR